LGTFAFLATAATRPLSSASNATTIGANRCFASAILSITHGDWLSEHIKVRVFARTEVASVLALIPIKLLTVVARIVLTAIVYWIRWTDNWIVEREKPLFGPFFVVNATGFQISPDSTLSTGVGKQSKEQENDEDRAPHQSVDYLHVSK